MSYQTFITHSLQKASSIATGSFGKVKSTTKGADNNQVLTKTDLEVGKFIIREIQAQYPDYNVIDEEARVIDKHSSFTWVVDPIDGTSKIWDNVAPQIIIEEAGGTYTDFIGRSIDYSNPLTTTEKNFTICTGPPILHHKLQEIIAKHQFKD